MRKGYKGEYKINKMLEKEYPNCDILRNALCDFMIIKNGKIVKLIEVKSTHKKKFYPKKREKRQIEKIREFSIKHNCDSEIWLNKVGNGIEIIFIYKSGDK